MCTLTYIPLNNGYIFTHNRDERMDRPTSRDIQQKVLKDQTVFYPKDLEANGSWIAYSDKNVAACLLNGGDRSYKRKSSYRKSRGLVVLESFEYGSPKEFYDNYDFSDIETFTLIIKSGDSLSAIVQDEDGTAFKELNPKRPGIWSSTTLYTKSVRDKREQWFANWLKADPDFAPDAIKSFHQSAGEGDGENDLVMSRWGILKTVSISQIANFSKDSKMRYWDFVGEAEDQIELKVRNESEG